MTWFEVVLWVLWLAVLLGLVYEIWKRFWDGDWRP